MPFSSVSISAIPVRTEQAWLFFEILERITLILKKSKTRRPRSGLKVVRAFTNPQKLSKSKFAKIPSPVGGGGVNQFPTFDAESKFAKFLLKNIFAENCFRAKKCLEIVLDFEYQVVRAYEPQKDFW